MIPLIGGIPRIEPLQIAVAALPGYREALELATEADQWLKEQPALPDVDPALAAHVTDEWVDAVRARETALTEYEARRKIVQTRLHQEANRARSIFNTSADLLLGALQQDLTQLLDAAEKHVADLNGATTPAQVIAADVGEAWRKLTTLAEDYQTLRHAQEFVMMQTAVGLWKSSTPQLPAEQHANRCYIKNIDTVWPGWRGSGLSGRPQYLDGDTVNVRRDPWPADTGPELLVWLVNSDAEPWIPTLKELRALTAPSAPAPFVDEPPPHPNDVESAYDRAQYGPQLVEAQRQREAAQHKKQQLDQEVPA